MATFDEWFESKYPKRVYGEDAELALMRTEYREVWEAAISKVVPTKLIYLGHNRHHLVLSNGAAWVLIGGVWQRLEDKRVAQRNESRE